MPSETACRDGYVRVESEAGERGVQPIGSTGEEPMAPGRSTFCVDGDGLALAEES